MKIINSFSGGRTSAYDTINTLCEHGVENVDIVYMDTGPIRPLSSLQSAVFLINSRSHLVTATPTSLESKSHHQQGRTFSRSYGTILPSSFTRVLSSALGFSPHPPVLVWGTVCHYLKLRGFSWKHGIDHFAQKRARYHVSGLCSRICLRTLPTRLNRDIQHPDDLAYSVPSSQ